MSVWLFGNTTVRSPFRLIDGLQVFSTTNGDIRGTKEKELKFCKALANAGIITSSFNANEEFSDTTYSVGRKWRSALEKLGFIEEKNNIYVLTKNGTNLLYSKTVFAEQECFLRSLILYSIPCTKDSPSFFSPLILTLTIMSELEKIVGDSTISFQEMCAVIQLKHNYSNIQQVIDEILLIRQERKVSAKKKNFDKNLYESKVPDARIQASSMKDYADTNFRYLKATGLFISAGKGIKFLPGKELVISNLLEMYKNFDISKSKFDIKTGAKLPTDNLNTNLTIIKDLEKIINDKKIETKNITLNSEPSIAEVNDFRYYLEEVIFEDDEKQFAANQKNEWLEIFGYMDLLISNKNSLEINGTEISIPSGEKPAYFEWILWRAFLALNHLVIEPQNCRRFKIDHDFKPINHAPGGGSDVVFEYENFKILGEVTLTNNSRQEAAEGEPVRRHIALETIKTPHKQIYGLFVAVSIDTNTVETFRHGTWYHEDVPMDVKILPMTLKSLKIYLESIVHKNNVENGIFQLQKLMNDCLDLRKDSTAPEWKNKISEVFTNELIH